MILKDQISDILIISCSSIMFNVQLSQDSRSSFKMLKFSSAWPQLIVLLAGERFILHSTHARTHKLKDSSLVGVNVRRLGDVAGTFYGRFSGGHRGKKTVRIWNHAKWTVKKCFSVSLGTPLKASPLSVMCLWFIRAFRFALSSSHLSIFITHAVSLSSRYPVASMLAFARHN